MSSLLPVPEPTYGRCSRTTGSDGDGRGGGLGVTRQALSDLVYREAGVSVMMSMRLSRAFGSKPETCLGIQTACDLWRARERANRV